MLIADINAGWKTARQAGARPVASHWQPVPERNLAHTSGWAAGKGTDLQAAGDWSAAAMVDQQTSDAWGTAATRDGAPLAATFERVPVKDMGLAGAWDHKIGRAHV